MIRPLSNDLRERVVSAVIVGESCRSVAARFDVAVSSVVSGHSAIERQARWLQAKLEDTANLFLALIVTSLSSGLRRYRI